MTATMAATMIGMMALPWALFFISTLFFDEWGVELK